jgi:hypothetical protein
VTGDRKTVEVEDIITEAAKLPLGDAAFALWRKKSRLDTLEGRPTRDDVRIYRALTPEQQTAKRRFDRDHADEGPIFMHLKRAHPHADDNDIKRAIRAAVGFDRDCFAHFKWEGDFWDCVVRAVAMAARTHPEYLDSTYSDARHHVAYYMK